MHDLVSRCYNIRAKLYFSSTKIDENASIDKEKRKPGQTRLGFPDFVGFLGGGIEEVDGDRIRGLSDDFEGPV